MRSLQRRNAQGKESRGKSEGGVEGTEGAETAEASEEFVSGGNVAGDLET